MATEKMKQKLETLMNGVSVAKWRVTEHLMKMYPTGTLLAFRINNRSTSTGEVVGHTWANAADAPFIRVKVLGGSGLVRNVATYQITEVLQPGKKVGRTVDLVTGAIQPPRGYRSLAGKPVRSTADRQDVATPWTPPPAESPRSTPAKKKTGKKLTVAAVIAERAPAPPVPVFDRTKAALLQPVKKVAPAFKTARTGKK